MERSTKGATISEFKGNPYLYVTNFRSGKVEVYDTNFKRVHLSEERFDDDRIPHDFAPFNVQAIGKNLFVTYAKQDAAETRPRGRPGPGLRGCLQPVRQAARPFGSWRLVQRPLGGGSDARASSAYLATLCWSEISAAAGLPPSTR